MAEAVAGLSLAANILQMVEYGAVFVTTAWRMHSEQAETNIVKDFKQLQYFAKDVEKVLGSLDQKTSGGDPELANLAEECRKVTVEILAFVGKIGDQKSWKTRMYKAVKDAFQLTWGQDKLSKLQTRLDSMRSQLTLRLVQSLRDCAAASSERQELVLDKIFDEIKQCSYKVDQALGTGLGSASVDLIALKHNKRLAESQSADIRESLKTDILGVLSGPRPNFEGGGSTEPRFFQVSPSRSQALVKKILHNLSYPDMLFREESVIRASKTTLHWIFEREQRPGRPWASFCQWLEAPDKQLYWITGKPGSGKSTLMKFISQPSTDCPILEPESSHNEARCLPFLKAWAGSHPLIVASYYFWAIGSPIQRSKEGMLRTLLHGILSQATPEAIAMVMPKTWEALHLFGEDTVHYTEDSLQKILSRTFQHLCPSTRICLFIDGLDEFEGQHENLVLYLRDALKTYPIKLCVSSRQWQVFEDAFHGTPCLRLQDLTLPDMMEYVRSELYAGPAFAQLRERDPYFSERLNENVALRSDGVFLWLTLVVKSLRKGIAAGDRISDLQIRLDQLPQDLEALFERILDDLDPEYLDHAIQYFKLMEACLDIGLPNVMVFSYADEEDEMFGIKSPLSELDRKAYESRRDHLKRRLNSRCLGLLEITEPKQPPFDASSSAFLHASQSRVNYLHRTVGDFISRDTVREGLNRRASHGFAHGDDPHLRLCSAELAFVKSNPLAFGSVCNNRSILSFVNRPRRNCLLHAARVKKPGLQSMLRLIEVLERLYPVCSDTYAYGTFGVRSDVWGGHETSMARSKASEGNGPLTLRGSFGPAFMVHAIECGVVEYIRIKAHRRHSVLALKLRRKASLAGRAYKWLPRREVDMWSEIDWQLAVAVLSTSPIPAMVELLLEMGADPQYVDDGESLSTWKLALMVYMNNWYIKSQEREKWTQIVALMVRHGAPIESKIIAHAYQEMEKRLNVRYTGRFKMAKKEEAFCANLEEHLKNMKQELR